MCEVCADSAQTARNAARTSRPAWPRPLLCGDDDLLGAAGEHGPAEHLVAGPDVSDAVAVSGRRHRRSRCRANAGTAQSDPAVSSRTGPPSRTPAGPRPRRGPEPLRPGHGHHPSSTTRSTSGPPKVSNAAALMDFLSPGTPSPASRPATVRTQPASSSTLEVKLRTGDRLTSASRRWHAARSPRIGDHWRQRPRSISEVDHHGRPAVQPPGGPGLALPGRPGPGRGPGRRRRRRRRTRQCDDRRRAEPRARPRDPGRADRRRATAATLARLHPPPLGPRLGRLRLARRGDRRARDGRAAAARRSRPAVESPLPGRAGPPQPPPRPELPGPGTRGDVLGGFRHPAAEPDLRRRGRAAGRSRATPRRRRARTGLDRRAGARLGRHAAGRLLLPAAGAPAPARRRPRPGPGPATARRHLPLVRVQPRRADDARAGPLSRRGRPDPRRTTPAADEP